MGKHVLLLSSTPQFINEHVIICLVRNVKGGALSCGSACFSKLFLIVLESTDVIDIDDLAARGVQFIRCYFC